MNERPRPLSEYDIRFAQLPSAVREYVVLGKTIQARGLTPDRQAYLKSERLSLLRTMTPLEKAALVDFGQFVSGLIQKKPGGT